MWVVFDLDGTLIDSEQIWADVRRRFVVDHGGTWHDHAQAAMMGMRTTEWAQYIRDDLGVALPPPQIAAHVVDAVKERLAQSIPILPGAKSALERLAGDYTLGLATSAAASVEDSGNGIRSAAAAGLAVVAIPNHDYPPEADALALATTVLSDLEALEPAVIRNAIAGLSG